MGNNWHNSNTDRRVDNSIELTRIFLNLLNVSWLWKRMSSWQETGLKYTGVRMHNAATFSEIVPHTQRMITTQIII